MSLNRGFCEGKSLLDRFSFLARKQHPFTNDGTPHI